MSTHGQQQNRKANSVESCSNEYGKDMQKEPGRTTWKTLQLWDFKHTVGSSILFSLKSLSTSFPNYYKILMPSFAFFLKKKNTNPTLGVVKWSSCAYKDPYFKVYICWKCVSQTNYINDVSEHFCYCTPWKLPQLALQFLPYQPSKHSNHSSSHHYTNTTLTARAQRPVVTTQHKPALTC